MSYYSNDSEPIIVVPDPPPTPPKKPIPWQWITLGIAVLGLLLPPNGGWKFDSLPIPIPIIDTKPDPAKTEWSWVVVVEQTEARTPEQAKLLRDLPYWQSLEKRGLKWRHYDYDAEDAKAYRALADTVGIPAAFVVGGQGDLKSKVLAKFPLPAKDVLDAKIKEVTGR